MVIEGDSSFTIPDDVSVVPPRECGTPEGDSSKPTLTGTSFGIQRGRYLGFPPMLKPHSYSTMLLGSLVISCKTGGFPRDRVVGLIKMLMDLGI